MEIKGVTLDQFRHIVAVVSDREYDGNVIVHPDSHKVSNNRIRARLTVKSSYEHGARMSWSGRHIRAASWHAYRDVLAELFDRYPDAIVRTAMATYKGAEGFAENYPETAYKNVGSIMSPVTMPELSI